MGCIIDKSSPDLEEKYKIKNNDKPNGEKVLLLFCRHGERSDNSEIPEERARIDHSDDPPLSNLGVS